MINKAKFQIGSIVKHKYFDFRGVIFDVDPEFNKSIAFIYLSSLVLNFDLLTLIADSFLHVHLHLEIHLIYVM